MAWDMTTIRLAYNPAINSMQWNVDMTVVRLAAGSGRGFKGLADEGPSVRLAFGNRRAEAMALDNEFTMRLAHAPGAQGDRTINKEDVGSPYDKPALLISYVYLKQFLAKKAKFVFRDWVMDSGAFSAHNSGTVITLQGYIDTCKMLMDTDPTLSEIFALDVIGDWKASLKNVEEMWRQGIKAIPCFHVGEPEHVLKTIASMYPKIALGGAVGFKGKDKWAEQCFSRVWPKRIHGFGFGAKDSIMALPWHSCDATNWEIGPCKFGRWNSFGKMSIRGSNHDLRGEVRYYLEIEKQARLKWASAMKKLESLE